MATIGLDFLSQNMFLFRFPQDDFRFSWVVFVCCLNKWSPHYAYLKGIKRNAFKISLYFSYSMNSKCVVTRRRRLLGQWWTGGLTEIIICDPRSPAAAQMSFANTETLTVRWHWRKISFWLNRQFSNRNQCEFLSRENALTSKESLEKKDENRLNHPSTWAMENVFSFPFFVGPRHRC